MINKRVLLITLASSLILVGCASKPSTPIKSASPSKQVKPSKQAKRYSLDKDTAPDKPINVDHVENATPIYEPYSLGGNKNYTVHGKHYTIIKNASGFKQEGLASWYGKKFHGHKTSNGEIYDMYSMSAAHKELPIPSYVKVLNKDNGKTVIVRVNDRGPFHAGRIIDLSYTAALKLGVIHTGTAHVAIEVIKVDKPHQKHKKKALKHYVIQVASSQYKNRVETLAHNLSQKLSVKSYVNADKQRHRLFLGPFSDYLQSQKTLEQVKKLGYSSAFIKSY